MDNALRRLVKSKQKQMWSNFLLTINTNICPRTVPDRVSCTDWLNESCQALFSDWDTCNGTCLKPAGAPNRDGERVDGTRVVAVRVKVSIEQGKRRGQMHAHIALEVCHTLTEANQWGLIGVHVNRESLNEFFNRRLGQLQLVHARVPEQVYLNSRLLTKGTDNSNKWLTLEYLEKDVDAEGTDLRAQEEAASARDREIAESLRQGENIDIDI